MVRRIWLVAALLGAVAAPLSAQSVKAGIEAWQRADYAAAVAIWRPLAEKGDADAAFNLGQAYRLGRGVPTNLGAAQTWFERAANKGHVDAQATLGLLLFQNGNQPEGLKWLKAAAEQGEPRALLVYGTALFNGDSVAQDPILGYAYISRAAAQGLAPAKETLAQLDKLLPLEDRKKGLALAMAKAKAAPPPGSKAAKVTKSAAKPVKTAEAKPAKSAPPAAEPKAAPASAPASGNWRIQLGAFSQRGSAEALYKKIAGNGALAGRQPYYVPAGAVTRLQVGPFASRGAAQAACSAVKQACFPVPAK
ncbi:MAG TPA: SPOR domain-containing protein [Sphingomicrobium sp.]|jgi:TPR repeat protein|nr:SPOR domain-containing protein [Sphingomicrobium sp.]